MMLGYTKSGEKNNSSLPGFEPGIFWSVVRRVIHCATGPADRLRKKIQYIYILQCCPTVKQGDSFNIQCVVCLILDEEIMKTVFANSNLDGNSLFLAECPSPYCNGKRFPGHQGRQPCCECWPRWRLSVHVDALDLPSDMEWCSFSEHSYFRCCEGYLEGLWCLCKIEAEHIKLCDTAFLFCSWRYII